MTVKWDIVVKLLMNKLKDFVKTNNDWGALSDFRFLTVTGKGNLILLSWAFLLITCCKCTIYYKNVDFQ